MSQIQDFLVREVIEAFLTTADLVVDLVQEFTQLGNFALLFNHAIDLLAQTFGREAQVGFEDLTNVHTRRYAQRVENDVDRGAIGIVRHVFNRHDHGDHTLVTVTTGHLVARLDATTDCQVNLDDFQHAWSQVIALLQFALLVFELVVQQTATINDVGLGLLELLVQGVFSHAQFEPLAVLKTVENFVGDVLAFLQTGAAFGFVADQSGTQTFESSAFDDTELFVEVLADLVQLGLLDRQGTSITLNAIAGEDLYVDDSTFGTGRYTQGSVFNVAGFSPKIARSSFLPESVGSRLSE